MNPTEEVCAVQDVYCCAILDNLNTGMMYTGQTGLFPLRSNRNIKLNFMAYIYDINTILAVPLKTRTSESMMGAFNKVLNILDKHNCNLRVNVI